MIIYSIDVCCNFCSGGYFISTVAILSMQNRSLGSPLMEYDCHGGQADQWLSIMAVRGGHPIWTGELLLKCEIKPTFIYSKNQFNNVQKTKQQYKQTKTKTKQIPTVNFG